MKSKIATGKTEIEIGKWTYHKEFGRLSNQRGIEYYIEKRLNKLFQILIENRESIVKRDEIIEYVWNEVLVNEENLTKGVFDLRRLLKKQGLNEIEIVTIRNIGYQLKIKEEESKKRLIIKKLLKASIYVFMILSFMIMFIRAIRY